MQGRKKLLSAHGSVATEADAKRGFLDDQFLIAMPGMKDDRFARSVIYICAHSEEGAMGLIINQPAADAFPDLLVQLGIMDEQEAIRLPAPARDFVVRNGGPVDRSRGFVLHSDDYRVESSLPVSEDICLTATVDILRAISYGRGPQQGADGARLFRLGRRPAGKRDRRERLADLPGAAPISCSTPTSTANTTASWPRSASISTPAQPSRRSRLSERILLLQHLQHRRRPPSARRT